jgi:hypothetical protein
MYDDVFVSKEQGRSWLENLHNESLGNKLCSPSVLIAIKLKRMSGECPIALGGHSGET